MIYYLRGGGTTENRIGELRREAGLTLKELGKILHVRDNALSQYETGKRNPQLGLAEEIANYFGVSLEYLMKKTDKRDYPIKSDNDAINLLKQIKNKEIGYHSISRLTLLELALWITKNITKIQSVDNSNQELAYTAYNLIHHVNIDVDVYNEFSEERIADAKKLDEIDKILMSDGGSTILDNVLTFIKESDRIGYDQTDLIISEMKKLPTHDPEEP